MGTWGAGTFDDDIACDWLEDLFDSDPIAFFRQCLDLTGIRHLEHLACIGVVCTAEVIHAHVCKPRSGLPEVVDLWVDEHRSLDLTPLVPHAVSSLRRVIDPDSAMHQMWDDSQAMYRQWLDHILELLRRLEEVSVKQI